MTGDYSFLIKDINTYPGFLEDFFKWFYPILINIVLEHFDLTYKSTYFARVRFKRYIIFSG